HVQVCLVDGSRGVGVHRGVADRAGVLRLTALRPGPAAVGRAGEAHLVAGPRGVQEAARAGGDRGLAASVPRTGESERRGEPRPWRLAAVSIGLAAALLACLAPTAVAAQSPACSQRVLVLSAMPLELDPLLSHAKIDQTVVVDSRTFYVGTLEGNDVVMALTGIGTINATQTTKAALARFRCGAD